MVSWRGRATSSIDALSLCEELDSPTDHRACYSGVFMENVIGGLSGLMGHVTEYLSDDPHFPCNTLDETYVQMCYFYQSTRMMILYENDLGKVARPAPQPPKRPTTIASAVSAGTWAASPSEIPDAPSNCAA